MLKLKRNKNIMMGMNINMNIFMNVIMFFHQFNVQRISHVYLEVNVERKVQFRMEIKFNHMNLWGLSIVVCGILRQLNITKVFLSMF